MKTRQRAITAAVTSLAIALGILTAPAAHAASDRTTCPLGYVCIWDDPSFRTIEAGPREKYAYVRFQWYIPNYSGYFYANTNLGATNTATSIINNGRFDTAYMYASANKRNLIFSIPVGNDNFWMVGSHSDNIESGYFRTYN